MLKKRYRVTKEEFKTIFTTGATYHSPHFVLRFLKDQAGNEGFKGACVVSKKLLKSAVLRNKTKRRCYHAVKTLIIPHTTPQTFVLVVRKTILETSFQELKEELKTLLSKARIIKL